MSALTGRSYGSLDDLASDVVDDLYLEIAEYVINNNVNYPRTVGFYDVCIGGYVLSSGNFILTFDDADDAINDISIDEMARCVSYVVRFPSVYDLLDAMSYEYEGELGGPMVDGVLYDDVINRMRDMNEYQEGISLSVDFVQSPSIRSSVANEICLGLEIDKIRADAETTLEDDPEIDEGIYSILVVACDGIEYEWDFTVKRINGIPQAFGEYGQNYLVDVMTRDCNDCALMDCSHDEAIESLLPFWDGQFD